MYDIKKLKKALLYHRIAKWTKDYLILDDGTKVTIECSEQDCCASAGGEFKDVKLDAVITDVKLENGKHYPSFDDEWCDETESSVDVVIYHNRNQIAKAECQADNGNGDYYYSICALKVGKVEYNVLGSSDYVKE
ncbi:hypothetical protein QS460_00650 [Liquorilactobacillus mali]|uniref:DUF7448 domain-containing protein n=1 Tax=Liquorilactobacillus mali TaxID=1618 RepID=A0A0R2FXL9_9LACO|nr:hypothetical protein [Liquorilactobacillus mali]KRN31109.1 hypothetical protein IV36_GL001916 [Liquorilactobacillus mali]MDN7144426.1 hypothetical protein [Liquorilactobacillus mali]